MTGRLRFHGQPVGFYVRLPLPLPYPLCPLRCIPLCCSRSHVYISVRPVIDIPNLLFTLLSHYSSLLLQLDLMRSKHSIVSNLLGLFPE